MMEKMIKVGYGRADITPKESIPLGGYGNGRNRFSEEIRDKLFATCIAFTDAEDNTVLLFTTDTIRMDNAIANGARDILCPEFGLPRENIQVASTHTHSAPETTMTNIPAVVAYRDQVSLALAEAGRKAMADRLPAIPYVGFTQTERMNFIRHYRMADGTYCGANFGSMASGVVGHASASDPWLQVIKFSRVGGKDVMLVNFQAHACFTGGMDKKVVSSDYIGALRRYVQTMTNAQFAYFLGAAGNHNGVSFYPREHRTTDVEEYGKLLGEYVLRALEAPVQVRSGKVAVCRRSLELELDHSDDHKVDACRAIQDLWTETLDRNLCNAKAREIGLNSIYAANCVVNRSALPKSENMDIYTIRVGDLAFACAPYEMFAASGMQIKDYSPFSMTFVVSCCNHSYAYLATDLAFTHGCYEVDTRRYPRGTAEKLANNFVEMLTEMKE